MANATDIEKKRDFHILLLGKTGTGKSSTGNTILGQTKFQAFTGAGSGTKDVTSGWTETDRFNVRVIDGPGLEDTDLTQLEDKERAIALIETALMQCDIGVNALIYVIKFGDRFGSSDRSAVEDLKKIMGEKMGNFSIVVLTCGSKWLKENTGTSFDQWCRNEENDRAYHGMFSFCDYRCVLFENKKQCELTQTQVNNLLMCVEDIANERGFYTNDLFGEAKANQEKLIMHLKAPILKPKFEKQIDLLLKKINAMVAMDENDRKIEVLREILKDAQYLLIIIEEEDKESGALDDLKEKIMKIINSAQESNGTCMKRLADEINEMQRTATRRWNILTGVRTVSGVAAVAAGGAATLVTGGLAFPLLLLALGYAGLGTSIGTTVAQIATDRNSKKKLEGKWKLFKGK